MSNKSNRATVKKRSILLSGLFVLMMCLAGCSDDDEQPDPQLPPLVWPDDVAAAIPDEGFREYCLERHDKDKDGRLSKDEVLAVTSMIIMMHEIFAHLKGSNISGISKNCIGATATFRISIYATTPDSKECVWKGLRISLFSEVPWATLRLRSSS